MKEEEYKQAKSLLEELDILSKSVDNTRAIIRSLEKNGGSMKAYCNTGEEHYGIVLNSELAAKAMGEVLKKQIDDIKKIRVKMTKIIDSLV